MDQKVELTTDALLHTSAKGLWKADVGLEEVVVLMGYGNIATTAIYTVPHGQDLARAVKPLDD
jgi:site-specific recombinase XerD